MTFDYYSSNIKQSAPLGRISAEEFFRAVRSPRPAVRETLVRLRTETDPKVRAELKTGLYAFTPCVQITGRRRYADITAFTGLAVVDFDHLQDAPAFKQYLFDSYSWIWAAWLSASGRGVRGFIKIPVVNTVDDFKLHFNALYNILQQYHGCDRAPQNPVLPLFLSYDPEILIRDDSPVFTSKLRIDPIQHFEQFKYDIDQNDRVFSAIKSAIDKITSNGHPQLRAAAYALGGYVGAGYLHEERAIHYIEHLIDTNPYLSIKPSVYKRTARTMIKSGTLNPLTL